ncbi:MAG: STAS domain-containing protein [Desulfobacterales bacterium]|nr:MAG: STAS domain-containing protein [Desulfobacterales bacterium]
MPEHNEIRLEKHSTVTVFCIEGDVTAFSEPFLNTAYQKANEQGAKKILLKFDKDAYINSGGIAVLIQILAETRRNNQDTAITGVSDHFKKIFHMVGITKFAKIFNTLEEALALMTKES